ncbi:MAG: hypothetical protein ABS889_03885, partial [Desemzia incerta]
MDYTKMILTEYMVRTIINEESDQNFDLLFKMDGDFYTGHFLKYADYNEPYRIAYDGIWGYKEHRDVFSIEYVNTQQTIRNSFFDFVFGPEKNVGDMRKYTSHPELVLQDIKNFVEQYDSEFLNPTVKDIKSIYNLNNINTGKSLDF